MPRPTTPFGGAAAYLPKTGQDVFDADLTSLPVTKAVRDSWTSASPVASADFAAAALVAIHDIETRIIALES